MLNIYAHKGEGYFLPECFEDFCRTNSTKRIFHVMFVGNQHIHSKLNRNMCEFESQDATKITSVSADSCINFSWTMMSLLVRFIVFVFGSYDHFSQCFTSFSQHCIHVVIKFDWCGRVNKLTRKASEQRRENHCYEPLAERHRENYY